MSMPYSKIVSLIACLLTFTGIYGCQYAQQKVYQQAANASVDHDAFPYSESISSPSRYEFPPEPAPAPVENNFPPPAPPSLLLPSPENDSNENVSWIRKISQQFVSSEKSVPSEQMSESEEPAQKYLGLVPHHSPVSQKMKQMNGKVKNFYSKMKSKMKSPQWIRNVSDNQEIVQEAEMMQDGLSCVESTPLFQEMPLKPETNHLQPIPVLPEPEVDKQNLPRLPPPGETTYWENSWKVSATLEQQPVKNYSTLEDEIEWWPYSKQKMQQAAQAKNFKVATPVSTPRYLENQEELKPSGESTVPAMLSQEQPTPIQKISLQRMKEIQIPKVMETSEDSPILITPRKSY